MSERRMQRYLDGLLSDEERARFEARLQADPALRRQLDRLGAARDALLGLEPVPLAAEVTDRIVDAASRAQQGPAPGSRWRWQDAWRVAAVVGLVAVALGFGAGFVTGRATPSGMASDALAPAGAVRLPVPGLPRDPLADAALASPAGADAPQFLVLLHGPPETDELNAEIHEWRTVATAAWADALGATGRLVAAGELAPQTLTGLAAGGVAFPAERADPETWFAEPWMVPTRFFLFRARDLEEAARLAGVLPDRSLGGTITVGRVVREVSGGP